MTEKSEILIVFSTELEAESFLNKLNETRIILSDGNKFKLINSNVDILISGIGIPATTYSLTKKVISKKYDLVINAGICGTFNEDLSVGECVSVISDEFADIGISYPDASFNTLFEEYLLKPNTYPFSNGELYNPLKSNIDTELPKVTAITVNTVSGNTEQINFRKEKFNSDIETMEGAACAFVCLKEKINFLQIRAVSNIIEERNKAHWNIPLALKNLGDELFDILNKITIKEQETLIVKD